MSASGRSWVSSEGALKIIGLLHPHWVYLHAQVLGRLLYPLQRQCRVRVGRIPEDGNAGEGWEELLKEFQTFPFDSERERGHARNVPPGPRQTGDEPRRDRVPHRSHDNGNRGGGLLRRQGRGGPPRRE
jgi:hypothetical protein